MLKCTFFMLTSLYMSHCANILGVFPVPSSNHITIHQTITKELSLKGHQVTVITANSLNSDNLPNLTEIEISSLRDIAETKRKLKDNYMLSTWLFAGTYYQELVEEVLTHLGSIFPDPKTHFDLVLVENVNPLIFSLACRFKSPIIGISSGIMPVFNQDMLGNPSNPALYFDLTTNLNTEVDFLERVTNFVRSVIGREFYSWYYLPFVIDGTSKKYLGAKCPYIWNLQEHVSLILRNTIPGLHPVRANLPTFIETNLINGMSQQVQNHSDKIPEDIVCLDLDFSSNLTLPYRTLWKHQIDHRNVKVFVTKGDLSSVEEAITNAVPVVGVPSGPDQVANIRQLVKMGVGKSIDRTTLTMDVLRDAIVEVAENLEYRRKMENLKDLVEDRAVQSLNQTMWWIEYIIRHGNGAFLKGPAAQMYWYEFLYLDLVASGLGLVAAAVYLLVVTVTAFRTRSHCNNKKSC